MGGRKMGLLKTSFPRQARNGCARLKSPASRRRCGGLLAELGRSARGVKNAKQVVQDLSTLEDDLVQAEENKVRFHFVMLD